MNRNVVAAFVLLLVSVVCFSAAGYCFWAINDVYETLKYYGLESQYDNHDGITETINNFRFGMIKYSLGGLFCVFVAMILLIRKKPRLGTR